MDDKDLYAGLIRLHILHHAVVEGDVYGLWMIEELGRHGYRLSAGTLYPILHGLERKGYLRSSEVLVDGRMRRLYRATPVGRNALARAKERVWELFGEMFEPHDPSAKKPRGKMKDASKRNRRPKSAPL
jgi:DNA-binding PadR family transcriptional regulator